jgi:hypothetical protein
MNRIKGVLRDGTRIYLQYNDFGEYGYMVIFSDRDLDRCRFDNFDETWDVPTHPHHFHKYNSIDVSSSPMTGDPSNDIPLFGDLLMTGKLFHIDFDALLEE